MAEDSQIDRWHPHYFKTLGAPDEVEDAFQTILGYLGEVETMCNYKCVTPLAKVFDALDALPRSQKSKVQGWRNQVYQEKRAAQKKAKIDRIKGFEIGQLVKFRPNASHHSDEDGNHPWGIDHLIGRVTRRSTHTVSVIEVSRRRHSSEVEQTNYAGIRWRMHPDQDTIIDE